MKYLLEFLTGSSPIVFLPYFIFVYNKINTKDLNFNYFIYTICMPIGSGLWNVLGKYLQDTFKYSNIMRFFVISQISFFSLLITLLTFQLYNYNFSQWIVHFIGVYIFYLLTYMVTINLTEKILLNKMIGAHETNVILIVLAIFVIQQIVYMFKPLNISLV